MNKTDQTFKQAMQTDQIPRIVAMIDKEKIHLAYLQSQPPNAMIDGFIKNSYEHLAYLQKKHNQYVEYAQKAP
jgi:hypothetical protein